MEAWSFKVDPQYTQIKRLSCDGLYCCGLGSEAQSAIRSDPCFHLIQTYLLNWNNAVCSLPALSPRLRLTVLQELV